MEGVKKNASETILSGILEFILGILIVLTYVDLLFVYRNGTDTFIRMVVSVFVGATIGFIMFLGFPNTIQLYWALGIGVVLGIFAAFVFDEEDIQFFWFYIIAAVILSIVTGLVASSWLLFGVMLLIFILAICFTALFLRFRPWIFERKKNM